MYKKRLKIVVSTTIITLLILFVLPIAFSKLNATPSNEIKSETKESVVIEPTEKISIEISEDIDIAAKQKEYKNTDIVGRLEIPGLFNIVLVKGTDNSFYLNHSLTKAKDKKGTEYIDYRTNPDAKQVNIYGHNSRTYKIPFRKLEKFKDKKFFDENEFIVLQYEGGRRIYRIFSIKEVDSDYEHMKVSKTGEEFVEHIKTLQSHSINTREVKYDEDSNILVLQTCSYGKDHTYYVISAIEIKNYTY